MKRAGNLILALLLVLAVNGQAHAQKAGADAIAIENPWARVGAMEHGH